jgi:outer membrane lipoprotein SlyB
MEHQMRTVKSGTFALALVALSVLLSGCPGKDEAQAREEPKAAAPCPDCGVITGIRTVQHKGTASGAGAFMGAVVGGVIGHQIGGGRGKDVATVAGAASGAAAGHEIEKRSNSTTAYEVSVRLENGSTRVISLQTPGGLAVGDKVKVTGNSISRQG